jgi:hypothetical protein
VDCGNGTQGDKSCAFNAAQLNLQGGTNPTQSTLTYNTGHAPTGTAGAAVLAPDSTGNLTVDPNNIGYFGVLVPLASGFVSGHCGQPTSSGGVWTLVDTGSACGSGGGDTITSPHSTIVVGGTSTNTTLDLAGGAGQIMAGATPALTSTPTLGASGTLGTLTLGNATSGLLTLAPVTGALGTVTASFPANTGTLAELNLAQSWTATQTMQNVLVGNAYNITVGTGTTYSFLNDDGLILYVSSSPVASITDTSISSTVPILGTGVIDGLSPMTITTSATCTISSNTSGCPYGGTYKSGYSINNDGSTAVTYTLPTAAAGLQYCVRNIAGATGTLTIQTSASGQYIDNAGTNTASGGYVISSGALGDSGCVVAIDTTHWELYNTSATTWTTH